LSPPGEAFALVKGLKYAPSSYSMVDDPEGVIRSFGKELIPLLGRDRGGRQ
jgi:hypothetical protein